MDFVMGRGATSNFADSRTLRQIRAGNISIITPPRPANTQTLIDG